MCVVRLVTRPGESCRLRCVVMCELGASKCGDHGPSWVTAQKKNKTKQNKTETKPKHNCPYIYNKLKKCINRKYMNTVLFATVPTILVRSPQVLFIVRQYQMLLANSFATHKRTHTHTHTQSCNLFSSSYALLHVKVATRMLRILTLVLVDRVAQSV